MQDMRLHALWAEANPFFREHIMNKVPKVTRKKINYAGSRYDRKYYKVDNTNMFMA